MDDYMCDINKEHILFDPRQLPCKCGLTACLKCIKKELIKENNVDVFICKTCNTKNTVDNANELPKNLKLERLIIKNVVPLTQHFMQNASESLKKCEEISNNRAQFIDEYFKRIKRDFAIRIRTIKSHLDHLNEQFDDIIDTLETECLMNFADIDNGLSKEWKNYQLLFESSLLTLKEKNDEHLLLENIHKIKEYDNKFCQYQEEFKSVLSKYEFEPNNWLPSLSILGSLRTSIDEKKLFENVSINILDGHEINSICILNDEFIASKNKESRELHIYDKNFQIIQESTLFVDSLYRFSPNIIVCSDRTTNVYVCDSAEAKIYVVNRYLDRIKQTIGSSGKRPGQFCAPSAIFYYGDKLFVLDTDNQRVQIFSMHGLFEREFTLFYPDTNNTIQNCNTLAVNKYSVAVGNELNGVFLFDFKGNFKCSISQECVKSMYFKSNYLFIHSSQGLLACYKISVPKDRNYDTHLVATYFNDALKNDSTSMIIDDSNTIILCFPEQKNIVQLKL